MSGLILSRMKGESIILGRHLARFQVEDIQGRRVKLRIEAHKSIPVHREEVYADIAKSGVLPSLGLAAKIGRNDRGTPIITVAFQSMDDAMSAIEAGVIQFQRGAVGFVQAAPVQEAHGG